MEYRKKFWHLLCYLCINIVVIYPLTLLAKTTADAKAKVTVQASNAVKKNGHRSRLEQKQQKIGEKTQACWANCTMFGTVQTGLFANTRCFCSSCDPAFIYCANGKTAGFSLDWTQGNTISLPSSADRDSACYQSCVLPLPVGGQKVNFPCQTAPRWGAGANTYLKCWQLKKKTPSQPYPNPTQPLPLKPDPPDTGDIVFSQKITERSVIGCQMHPDSPCNGTSCKAVALNAANRTNPVGTFWQSGVISNYSVNITHLPWCTFCGGRFSPTAGCCCGVTVSFSEYCRDINECNRAVCMTCMHNSLCPANQVSSCAALLHSFCYSTCLPHPATCDVREYNYCATAHS